jgi:RND family efflux transporter MFP subunit
MNKIKAAFSWFLKDKKRIFFGLIIIGLLVFGYIRLFGKKAPTTQTQTAAVEKGTIVSSVSVSGSVLTANTLPITTSATGVVSKVYVKDGQTVYQGQKLADIELDSEGAQANASAYANLVSASNSLQSAQNNFRSAEATLERVYDDIKGHATDETLVMKETRTKAEVGHDNAYDQVRSAKVNLASVSLSYRNTSPAITASYSGTIGNITIVEGMSLSSSTSSTSTSSQGSGQRVAVIAIKGTPIASFNISEVDVSKVTQGQKATIILDSISDKTFTGKVVSIDKMGVTSNGVTNYPVIIQFDTESPDILPNMAATANIILESKSDVLIVPSSAVTTANGQSMVKVMRNGSQETVSVETGLSSSTQVEITSGLSEGDTVVTGTISTSPSSQQTSVFSTGGFGGALRGR